MSKRSDDARRAIERNVFDSSEPTVVALTGGWGEGKTYFWKTVIAPAHEKVRPGYISVFGAESLAVIRERVCIATFSEPKLQGFEKLKAVSETMVRSVARVAKYWGGKIGAPDSLAVELLQTYRLKPGWVICIDDVERLSRKVGFENFLGYVAELRDRWNLKVVLIFNKGKVNENKVFQRYQEKVIDREIPFVPDFDEVVGLVFENLKIPGFDLASEALVRAQVLKLKNIRILARAKSYFQEVLRELPGTPDGYFLRTAFGSVLLFTYTKFSSDKPVGLNFSALVQHNDWADRFKRFADDDGGKAPIDPLKDMLERYQYLGTDDLDKVLMQFVETDVLDVDRLRQLYSAHLAESGKERARARMRGVWESDYHGKFQDNSQELGDAIEEVLPEYLPFIPPNELDFALRVLTALGRGTRAREFFELFLVTRGAKFQGLSEDSMPMGPFKYPPLRDFITSINQRRNADIRTLDQVLSEAFKGEFVSQRDAKRLDEFSDDEIADYFLGHPQPKLTKKLERLMKESDGNLRRKVESAAKKLAERNSLNRMRLEEMGLVKPATKGDKNL